MTHGRISRGLAAASLAVALAACTDATPEESDPAAEAPPAPGAIRGRLVSYIADFEDGRTEELHALRIAGRDDERRLLFAVPPVLEAGSLLDVWGKIEGDAIRVARFATIDEPPRVERALTNGAPLRPRKFALVLVDVGGGVNVTKDAAMQKLTGTSATDASVRQYYMEASYGRQDIAAEVFGPFKYTMNGCDTMGLRNAVRAMVPTGFDHYLYYIGSRVSACGWTGLASVGTPVQPSRDTWYNASTNCVVLVQEPGHNFGMRHSSSMLRCMNGNQATSFLDLPNMACTHSEYGDRFDPMGSSCGHMNGYQKAYQGWLSGCNVVDVNSTGTFTLLPIELGCNGVQLLQIKMPKLRPFYRSGGGGPAQTVNLSHYYVELRTPTGFDTRATPTPVVQIRVSNDIRQMTQGGLNTWFLDMNPATTALDGLAAVGTFVDPDPASGIKITVMAIDKTRATVRVEVPNGSAASTCTDGTALALPGPGAESCNAAVSSPNGPPPLPNDAGSAGGATGMAGAGGTAGARDGGTSSSPDAAASAGGSGGSGGTMDPVEQAGGQSGGGGAAGNAGGRSGSGGSAGRGGSAGKATAGESGDSDDAAGVVHGGCGCRVHDDGRSGGAAWALALASLALVRRTRRLCRASGGSR